MLLFQLNTKCLIKWTKTTYIPFKYTCRIVKHDMSYQNRIIIKNTDLLVIHVHSKIIISKPLYVQGPNFLDPQINVVAKLRVSLLQGPA